MGQQAASSVNASISCPFIVGAWYVCDIIVSCLFYDTTSINLCGELQTSKATASVKITADTNLYAIIY